MLDMQTPFQCQERLLLDTIFATCLFESAATLHGIAETFHAAADISLRFENADLTEVQLIRVSTPL